MDIERTNELIVAVINGHQADDICKTDEERAEFANLQRTQARISQYGFGLSPINEVDF